MQETNKDLTLMQQVASSLSCKGKGRPDEVGTGGGQHPRYNSLSFFT